MAVTKTISEFKQDFVVNLENKGRATATILAYKKDLEQLIEYLSGLDKADIPLIRPIDIEAFRDSLKANNYTDKSISRKLNAIKTFF